MSPAAVQVQGCAGCRQAEWRQLVGSDLHQMLDPGVFLEIQAFRINGPSRPGCPLVRLKRPPAVLSGGIPLCAL